MRSVLLYITISIGSAAFFNTSAAAAEALRVFAASSLAAPLAELATSFEAQENQEVTLVFASSSILARQISEGAPADVYVSASRNWMNYLQETGDISRDERKELTSNYLVLALLPASAATTEWDLTEANIVEFLGGRRFGICDPAHVPCGIYAREALESAGLWEILRPHLAFAPDARALTAWISRHEVGAAVLYASDAQEWASDVETIPMINTEYGPIRYEIAPINTANNVEDALKFTHYVIQNAHVFAAHGFTSIESMQPEAE